SERGLISSLLDETWNTGALASCAAPGRGGKLARVLAAGAGGVTAYALPRHVMAFRGLAEAVPQVHVGWELPVVPLARPHAVALPAEQPPVGHARDQVLAVAPQGHGARAGEGLKCLCCGGEVHAGTSGAELTAECAAGIPAIRIRGERPPTRAVGSGA